MMAAKPRLRLFALVATLGAVTSAASPARAEKSIDEVRAEALFEEGRRLMAARDFAAACPKLAESQQLDPAPGTLLNLAVCYERAGKTASAWASYKDAQLSAQRAGQLDRASAAAQKASELEGKLARITITVPPGARVAGLDVRCDGRAIHEPTWGVALPFDPGPHDVEAVAPGHRPWTTHLELHDGTPAAVAVPALEELPAPPPDERASSGSATSSDGATPARDGSGQRVVGLVIGGLGLAGVGVGAFAGLRAKSKYDAALAACDGGTTCPDGRGPALRDEASTWGAVSTVAFVAGGAALATGAILFFTAPRARSSAIAIGPSARGAGLSVSGVFW